MTEAERNAARDGSLVSSTTKEEESSQFRSRPNTSTKHHLGIDRAQDEDTEANQMRKKAFRKTETTCSEMTMEHEGSQAWWEAQSTTWAIHRGRCECCRRYALARSRTTEKLFRVVAFGVLCRLVVVVVMMAVVVVVVEVEEEVG